MSMAVAVFFVLSGYVIGHVTQQRERSAWDYTIARAARIYSVALPALALTFVLDSVGSAIHPELYDRQWGYIADGRAWQFLSGALFLNQLWFINTPQGSMLPYWSLAFEVWCYVIFGLALFAPTRWRWAAAGIATVVAGPRIAAMFPLWLLGVRCSRIGPRLAARPILGWALWLGSMTSWVGYRAWTAHQGGLLGYAPAVLGRPELVEDYLIACLFAANLAGFAVISRRFAPLLRPLATPIRWLAGATFTLYLLHLPVAQFLAALAPWPPDGTAGRTFILGTTLVGVFLIAEVTERRKAAWRTMISALLRRVEPVV